MKTHQPVRGVSKNVLTLTAPLLEFQARKQQRGKFKLSALCMSGTGDTQIITDDLIIPSLELYEFLVLWVDKRPKTYC
jgi:hypothetical protein